MNKFLLVFILTCFVLGCEKPAPETSFYIWKSNPDLTSDEAVFFQKTHAKKLYLRVFDVDIDQGKPAPKAVLKNFDSKFIDTDYIPVVFITNDSFKYLSDSDNQELAQNVFKLVHEIADEFDFDYQEIQIDCDWTGTTRENFFFFLKNLSEISQKKITSTLRLHQVKYRQQTGIPPVDKVYLMAYATSNPTENQDINSILDQNLLMDYLQNINDYPLDFDIALPLYSWAIVTNHLGRKKIINAVSQNDLNTLDFIFKDGYYIAQKDVFFKGFYVNKGFKIKLEEISPELLNETKTYLNKHVRKPYQYVYYHLDRQFTNRFNSEDL